MAIVKCLTHNRADDPISKGNVVHKQVFISTLDMHFVPLQQCLRAGDWAVVIHFQVLLIPPTTIKIEGKPTWIHASYSKKVPPSAQTPPRIRASIK